MAATGSSTHHPGDLFAGMRRLLHRFVVGCQTGGICHDDIPPIDLRGLLVTATAVAQMPTCF
jgi:hypothetical protein